MIVDLTDTAPTTAAEQSLYRSAPIESRIVWCPIRHDSQIGCANSPMRSRRKNDDTKEEDEQEPTA